MTGTADDDTLAQSMRRQLALPPHVLVVETNTHPSPTFSGDPYQDDPLRFIDEFKDAAAGNNWLSDGRKLDRIRLCLKGFAKDWMMHQDDIRAFSSFAGDEATSFLKRFKKTYVTTRWVTFYSMEYYRLRQAPSQSAPEYINAKLSMARKYEMATDNKLSEEKKICDVLEGLRESYKEWIHHKPMPTSIESLMATIVRLESQLNVMRHETNVPGHTVPHQSTIGSMQQTPYAQEHVNPLARQGLLPVPNQRTLSHEAVPVYYHASNDYDRPQAGKTKKLWEPKKESASNTQSRAPVLDMQDFENSMANMMDRIEATVLKAVSAASAPSNNGTRPDMSRCYNCGGIGHRSPVCDKPCYICGEASHPSARCPIRLRQRNRRMPDMNAKKEDFPHSRQ